LLRRCAPRNDGVQGALAGGPESQFLEVSLGSGAWPSGDITHKASHFSGSAAISAKVARRARSAVQGIFLSASAASLSFGISPIHSHGSGEPGRCGFG
jgi:hypothetical protein